MKVPHVEQRSSRDSLNWRVPAADPRFVLGWTSSGASRLTMPRTVVAYQWPSFFLAGTPRS